MRSDKSKQKNNTELFPQNFFSLAPCRHVILQIAVVYSAVSRDPLLPPPGAESARSKRDDSELSFKRYLQPSNHGLELYYCRVVESSSGVTEVPPCRGVDSR
ncbi:hypothetical protein TNCV_186371 [Trichonephila clavipes]|nr:hypothetical protein TNCV_186371 [Trichonephila clavipes]